MVDVPILSTIGYARGNIHPLIEFPIQWLVVAALVFFTPKLAGYLRNSYSVAVTNAGRSSNENTHVRFSSKIRYGFPLAGYLIYFTWLSTSYGQLLAVEGSFVGALKWFLIVPFIYLVVVIDYAIIFAHVQLILPKLLQKNDVQLDFSDRHRLGGMYQVGKALERSTMSYFLGLSAYSLLMFHPLILKDTQTFWPPPGDLTRLVFVGFWSVGVSLIGFGIYAVHKHMKKKRDEMIDKILDNIRTIGTDGKSYFYTNPSDESDRIEYVQEMLHLERVEETRTYPF